MRCVKWILLLYSVGCDGTGTPTAITPVTTPLEAVPFAELGSQRILLERAYEFGVALYLIDPATQTSSIVVSDALVRGAVLSPMGTQIAYASPAPEIENGYDLWRLNLPDTHTRLTTTTQFEGMPSWEPGIPALVYPSVTASSSAIARWAPVNPQGTAQELTNFNLAGSSSCPRAELAAPVARADNGDLLLVCGAAVWKLPIGGQSAPAPIPGVQWLALYTSTQASAVHAVRWSPDGQSIAFVEPVNGELLVRLMSKTGAGVTTLATVPSATVNIALFNIYSLCWSADGSRVLFTAPLSNSLGHLWTVRSDGTGLTQVTTAAAFDYNVSCAG
jgi:hypothetical protein